MSCSSTLFMAAGDLWSTVIQVIIVWTVGTTVGVSESPHGTNGTSTTHTFTSFTFLTSS